jgi:ABC-type Fe3+ transport system substrate-binding protein
MHGTAVAIDWRTPGGTTEILKQLESQYAAAIKGGRYELRGSREKPEFYMKPATIGFDAVFGGGTFDHGRLKTGVRASITAPDGKPAEVQCPMSTPASFEPAQLEAWFGKNIIGTQPLYDPDQYWTGVALSAFGIVYNRDVLKQLGLPEPRTFDDLTDARYAGWIALADPRQSGSIATSMDSILSNAGWERGWRVLREMCANTRYFTSASTKPPIDVSAGEAAAGLAIDFYGRGQSQAVALPGETPETSRVGYVDPAGSVYIDADPVSILRGGPHPELARRFIEFCLTEEGQALWQFHARDSAQGRDNPIGPDGERMGPREYELRRAPIRRVMYERYMPYFVDQSDPFKLASEVGSKGWRSAIGVMMGAFSIDIADEQRSAWRALNLARLDPAFSKETLSEMERLFYAWPETRMPDGTSLSFTPENCKAIIAAWKKPGMMPEAKVAYTRFFSGHYARVLELAGER